MLINKDTNEKWLNMTATVTPPSGYYFSSANLTQLSQGLEICSPTGSNPMLSSSPQYAGDISDAVNIQGETLNYLTGAYTAGSAYALTNPTDPTGTPPTQTVNFLVPAYTAVLVTLVATATS